MNLENSRHDLSTSSLDSLPSESVQAQSKKVIDMPTSPGRDEALQEIGQEAVNALKKKIEELDKEMAIKRKEIDELYAWLAADAKRRFKPLLENFLILFIETLCWRRGIPIPDTACNELKCQKAKYVALAGMIKFRNWEADYGIPTRYHKVVLDFPKYMLAKDSNIQRTEAEFANVLVSYYKGTPKYAFWGALFSFCFGETIEKVATRFDDMPTIEGTLETETE